MRDGLFALVDADGKLICSEYTDEETGEKSIERCVELYNDYAKMAEDIAESRLYGTDAENWVRNTECVLVYDGGAAGTITCPNDQTYEVVNPGDGSANYITPEVNELA